MESDQIKLKRMLSGWDGAASIICTVIGSGIFVSPKAVLANVGSPGMSLVIWVVSGFISLLQAFIYAELVLTFPEAGSDYVFIRQGFGDYLAFLYMWIATVFQQSASRSIVSLTFATYLCQIIWNDCEPPQHIIQLIAILALATLTITQCRSTWFAVVTSDAFTIAKLTGLGVIIVSGFGYATYHQEWTISKPFENTSTEIVDYIQATFGAFWAYGGINSVMNIVEELKEPLPRNILHSVTVAMFTVMLVYFLANMAYLLVLTPMEILESKAVAMTFGYKIFPALFWLMPFFVACSTIGGLNNGILLFPRLMMAGARQGHLPKVFSLLNVTFLTPMPHLFFNFFVTVLILSTGSIYSLIQYMSYLGVIINMTSVSTLIRRRLTHPDLSRPFRLPLVFPLIYWIISLFLLIYPLYAQPWTTLPSLVLIFSGTPVYFFLVYPEKPFPLLKMLEQSVTHFSQKFFNALPEEFEKRVYFEHKKNFQGHENPTFKGDGGKLDDFSSKMARKDQKVHTTLKKNFIKDLTHQFTPK